MVRHIINWHGLRQALHTLGAIFLCLGLAACFDFEQDLTIKSSGAGSLAVKLRMDPAFKGALDEETILGEQKAPVEVKREVKDGQYVQSERVTFNALSELKLQNETLSIVNNGTTFFGAGPKNLTLTRTVDNAAAEPDAFGLMRGLFQDRTYTFKVTVPGWVGKAYPLIVAGESIAPQSNGGTVSWQIPMARAMSTQQLVYRVDFLSYMKIEGNLTAERVPNHINAGEYGAGTP